MTEKNTVKFLVGQASPLVLAGSLYDNQRLLRKKTWKKCKKNIQMKKYHFEKKKLKRSKFNKFLN